jgi:hypothetical protein
VTLQEFTKYLHRKIDHFEQNWIIENQHDLSLDTDFETWFIDYYIFMKQHSDKKEVTTEYTEFTEEEAADYLETSKYMIKLFCESKFISKLKNGKFDLKQLSDFKQTERYKTIVGATDA